MSYETLDTIADAYIPLLLILFLLGVVVKLYRDWPNYRKTLLHVGFMFALLLVSYGLMFIDKRTNIWPTMGLDYSTHTAVALSLVIALCTLICHFAKWFVGSLFAYAVLMVYQQYHSVLDILSTAIVIALFAWLFFRMIFNKQNSLKI